jgi:hypothetical protein
MIIDLVMQSFGSSLAMSVLCLCKSSVPMSLRRFVGSLSELALTFQLTFRAQCIRVAEHNTRKMLIEELLNRNRLEKLLRDSFGNYCVQVRLKRGLGDRVGC